jgi:hypothetical protein
MDLKRCVIALNVYLSFSIVSLTIGSVSSYLAVGALYVVAFPGPVMNSHDCARGMAAGILALLAGALAGANVGSYFASKLLFLTSPIKQLDSELDYALNTIEWDTQRGREFRYACHYACAGSTIIALVWLADSPEGLINLSLGILAVMAGEIMLIYTIIKSLKAPIELD